MNEILNLMALRKEAFKVFLEKTMLMNGQEIEEAEITSNERNEIRAKIELIDKDIKNIYDSLEDADIISRVIKNKGNKEEYDIKYYPLFDLAQETFTLIYQAVKEEEVLLAHWNNLKDTLMEDIKATSNVSKISRYINALDDKAIPAGSLLSSRSRNA